MKRKDLIKKLEAKGYEFAREGKRHTIYKKGNKEEQVPRHREINEQTAGEILKRAEH